MQDDVGHLIEELVEPAAERRAGTLQSGEASVGGVEDQGECHRDGHDRATRPAGHAARDESRRREHQARRRQGHHVGPNRGRAQPFGQSPGQGKCPVFADRLIGQAAGQLLVGREDRLGAVEPPQHGHFRRLAAPQTTTQPGRVVEPIGPEDHGIRPRRTTRKHDGSGPLAGQLAELAVLFRPGMNQHRLARGRQLRGHVKQVAEHAPSQHHLGGHQAPRPARAGVNRQVERPRRHSNDSLFNGIQDSVFRVQFVYGFLTEH